MEASAETMTGSWRLGTRTESIRTYLRGSSSRICPIVCVQHCWKKSGMGKLLDKLAVEEATGILNQPTALSAEQAAL